MIKYIKEHIYKKNKISEKVTEGISRLMIIIVLLVFIVIFSTFKNHDRKFQNCQKLFLIYISLTNYNVPLPCVFRFQIEYYQFLRRSNQYKSMFGHYNKGQLRYI